MKTIDVLISTYSWRVVDALRIIDSQSVVDGVKYVVVHQADEPLSSSFLSTYNGRGDFKYFFTQTRGVTVSRNLALKNSCADIVLFADDDIELAPEFYKNIRFGYESYTGFITFKIGVLGSGEQDMTGRRQFNKHEFAHSKISILSVGTIEVSVDCQSLIYSGAHFPEDMGAGSFYPVCDEPVFLAMLLDSGIKGKYLPFEICKHPAVSSGLDLNGSCLSARGILFYRVFGPFVGFVMMCIFYLKKKLFSGGNAIKNIRCLIDGWRYAKKIRF